MFNLRLPNENMLVSSSSAGRFESNHQNVVYLGQETTQNGTTVHSKASHVV